MGRKDNKYEKPCGEQSTFNEACFKGEVPEEDSKDPKKTPIKVVVLPGEMEPSQYSPSDNSKINNPTVTLKVDLGGNIWIIGTIDKETLIMLKIRFTGEDEVSVLGKREDKKYDKEVCGK